MASVVRSSFILLPSAFILASLLRAILRRAASCRRATSLAGHPGPPAFGECALIQRGGHRARRLRRLPVVAVAIAPVRSKCARSSSVAGFRPGVAMASCHRFSSSPIQIKQPEFEHIHRCPSRSSKCQGYRSWLSPQNQKPST